MNDRMKKIVFALMGFSLLGAGCFAQAPIAPSAPTSVQNQMNGIASAQEVLRAHGLLLVEAQTKGVDLNQIDDWRERGQVASQLIQEGKYDQATQDIADLNAKMRSFLEQVNE